MDDVIHGNVGSEGTFESGVFGDQGWVWCIRPVAVGGGGGAGLPGAGGAAG